MSIFGGVAFSPRLIRLGRKWLNEVYYVYIIYSKTNRRRYIGSTADLRQRILEHNSGKSSYTSRARDWELLYYEAFISKKDARVEELFLKSGKGRERIDYLLRNTIEVKIGGVA